MRRSFGSVTCDERRAATSCASRSSQRFFPSVGALTAVTFVLTLGRPERFPHSRDVAGFLGLRPKQRQSGARDPQLGISKSGDPYLRTLLIHGARAVLFAAKHKGAWAESLLQRRPPNVAVVAMAQGVASPP